MLALPLSGADTSLPSDLLTAGKIEYANGNHDRAIELLRQLTKQDSRNAEAHLWLARALGRKAENSNPLRAAFLVGDIKRAFERAVELAPTNDDARGDLLDFYLEAPGSMGGGMHRAEEQARAMAKLHAGDGHWAAARIAEKKKDYALAEKELQLAQSSDPKPGRWRELAQFYKRRSRWTEMEAAFQKSDDAKSHYYLAESYLQRNTKLADAEQLVRKFIAGSSPPPGDEPTRAQARLLLGQVYVKLGRRADAQRELRAALAENPHLKAARRELERLR